MHFGEILVLKTVFLLLLCTLGLGTITNASQKGRLSEKTAKALIVRQMLAAVDWPAPLSDLTGNKSAEEDYLLCTFNDKSTLESFIQALENAEINEKKIKLANIRLRQNLSQCNAVYLGKPRIADIQWMQENQLARRTLLIASGRNMAKAGVHIGLFLNRDNTLEIELNADTFYGSELIPKDALIRNSIVLASEVEQKVKLLRTLINYTTWPDDDLDFSRDGEFNLCFFRNYRLLPYLKLFLGSKSFSGKKLNTKTIAEESDLSACHTVLLHKADQTVSGLLSKRALNRVLLIGDDSYFNGKGVHYNLAPGKSVRSSRFEINLTAFGRTGHSPHFGLLNSGALIQKDYAEYSRLLHAIVEQTIWPVGHALSSDNHLDLCVDQDEVLVENLQFFSQPSLGKSSLQKELIIRNLSQPPDAVGCEIIVTADNPNLSELNNPDNSVNNQVLLISSNKDAKDGSFHFKMNISPKQITLGIDLSALKAMGFAVKNELIELSRSGKGERNGH